MRSDVARAGWRGGLVASLALSIAAGCGTGSTVACASNTDCPGGLCVGGHCQVPCNGDLDCASTQRCTSGFCVEKSQSGPRCPEVVDDRTCDDGNACNGRERCDATRGCVAGTPLTCGDGNVCNGVETCDAKLGCVPGAPLLCDGGKGCAGTQDCDAVQGCVTDRLPSCDDHDACTADTCNAQSGLCQHVA